MTDGAKLSHTPHLHLHSVIQREFQKEQIAVSVSQLRSPGAPPAWHQAMPQCHCQAAVLSHSALVLEIRDIQSTVQVIRGKLVLGVTSNSDYSEIMPMVASQQQRCGGALHARSLGELLKYIGNQVM